MAPAPVHLVSAMAGTGASGRIDGPGSTAASTGQAALDVQGNLYVADTDNYCIRKVTPAGVVSTLAGKRTTTPRFIATCILRE